MVSVTLPQIVVNYRSRVLERDGLERVMYEHYCKLSQSQPIENFIYDIEKAAYRGYTSQPVSKGELLQLMQKEPKKLGVGITANIYLLVGVCLADEDGFIKNDDSLFKVFDIKDKYVASILTGSHCGLNVLDEDQDCCATAIRWLTSPLPSTELDSVTISEILSKPDEAICAIDLIFLEEILRKSLTITTINLSPLETVKQVLNEFNDSIRRITTDRYNSREGIKIQDEYDVQDILFSILKPIFPRLQRENPVGKIGGNSSRIDLHLPEDGLMIEIKIIKESDNSHLKYVQELKQDIVNYSTDYNLKNLVFFIYDPFAKTTNKQDFLDLERFAQEQSLSYNIHSILVKK